MTDSKGKTKTLSDGTILELVEGCWRTNACSFLKTQHPEWRLSDWDAENRGHWIISQYAPLLRSHLYVDTVVNIDDME
jgi:hypothetical protein